MSRVGGYMTGCVARVDDMVTVVRSDGGEVDGGGVGMIRCFAYIVAVASSKAGGIDWSDGGAVTVNSSSSLFSAIMVVDGNAIVQVLWDECS